MLGSTPATRLTWYPGSIPPYASLWHTILRVAALNCLRSGELPDWPATLSATGQRQRSLYPLHNTRAVVSTDVLASALGETPAVFAWSHFGTLAPWLRFVVTPGFRLCLPCLEAGLPLGAVLLAPLERLPHPWHATAGAVPLWPGVQGLPIPGGLRTCGQLPVSPAGILCARDLPLPDAACQLDPRPGPRHRLARTAVQAHQASAVAQLRQTWRKPGMAQSAVRVQ